MKLKKTQKTLLLSVGVMAGVLALAYAIGSWELRHLNSNPDFSDIKGHLVASFEAGPANSTRLPSGNVVNFDLGSRHSFMNRAAIERLTELGREPQIKKVLIWTTDADGRYSLYTEKAVIDVHISNPIDSLEPCCIRNVEVLVTDNDRPNVFGMDLIKNFAIERLWPENIVNIYYNYVPKSYHAVTDIDVHHSAVNPFRSTNDRCSIELTVNDASPRDYYFDTGGNMVNVEMVQPTGQQHMATSDVKIDSVTGLSIQRQCRVVFGDRLRYSNVVYCDSLHTDAYSVNPFKLFDQDVVLDIPGKRLMIHKMRADSPLPLAEL